MKVKAVLFDYTGTITSPSNIYAVYKAILKKLGLKIPPRRDFLENFTLPWQKNYLNLGVPESRLDETARIFKVEREKRKARLNAGVRKTLAWLKKNKIKTGIVSTDFRSTITKELKSFEIDKYIDVVVSYDDCSEQKPSPLPIILALKKPKALRKNVLFVGDMVEDMLAAKRADVLPVGVTCGYHSAKKLSKFSKYVIGSIGELPELIKRIETL